MTDAGRWLSRNETHDLSMIIKDRTKVLRAHADDRRGVAVLLLSLRLLTGGFG